MRAGKKSWLAKFQHTAARRRLVRSVQIRPRVYGFNTQPPEGGWALVGEDALNELVVSTHSRPKAAGMRKLIKSIGINVSTHSRPKAAGLRT